MNIQPKGSILSKRGTSNFMWWEGKESEEDGMAVENDGEGAGDFGVEVNLLSC